MSEEYYKIIGPIKVRKNKLFKHIANVLSIANSALGLLAIYFLVTHPGEHRVLVAKVVILAGIFDALDGRFSRMSTEKNPFGNILDSIADGITFGVVPFLAAYSLMSNVPAYIAYPVVSFFLFCAFYRLIRFTISPTKSYFHGAPTPLPTVLIISAYAMAWPTGWIMTTLAFVSAILMISRLPFPSLKGPRDPVEEVAFLIGSIGLAGYVLIPEPWFWFFPKFFFWYVVFYYTYGMFHTAYVKKRLFSKYWEEK